jgi:hypothetical protein
LAKKLKYIKRIGSGRNTTYLNLPKSLFFQPINEKEYFETEIDKRKINKISRKYKMKRSRKSFIKRTKRRLRSKYAKKSRTRALARKGGAWRSRKQRGGMPNYPAGHSQYLNNVPMTQTYSVGGPLSASQSALANPPPITTLCNSGSCTDNYNHLTNDGFPSRGSF